MSDRKPRGRPAGPGIDDAPMLMRMADYIVRNPGSRPTTTYKLLSEKKPNLTAIRRIQAKWRQSKEALLAAARARLEAANARRMASVSRGSRAMPAARPSTLADQIRDLTGFSRALRARDDFTDMITGGSVGRLMKEVDALTQVSRALTESPSMRAMSALRDNPASHFTRALEEQQRQIDRILGLRRF